MNNKKGFTLAELMVVLGILAVLIAVAIPVFSNQMGKAQQTVDDTNMSSAISMAYTDYLRNAYAEAYCYTFDVNDSGIRFTEGFPVKESALGSKSLGTLLGKSKDNLNKHILVTIDGDNISGVWKE